tara:strand:+ start:272 stop:466 length:195 start_codon:yes stop_codon:yes gene_type:complete
MEAMTIKKDVVGNSTFYINRVIKDNGLSFNFNRVNEKINRTYHYNNESEYNKAVKRAKNKLANS